GRHQPRRTQHQPLRARGSGRRRRRHPARLRGGVRQHGRGERDRTRRSARRDARGRPFAPRRGQAQDQRACRQPDRRAGRRHRARAAAHGAEDFERQDPAQRRARLFFWLCRIPLAMRGRENLPPSGAVVIASNHTSYLDGAVLLAILPWRNNAFVAKRELREGFITRTLVMGLGAQFVERFDVQKSAEHADELAQAAKRGVSLIVFPEGTLVRRTGLMPFRAGAFLSAAQAAIPVVPVALRGVRSVLRDGTWYPRRAPISVTVGAPVAPDGSDWNAA